MLALRMKEGAISQGMQVASNEFSLEPPEATNPNGTLILAQKDAFCTSNLLNYKIISLYCFKPYRWGILLEQQ